MKGGWIEKPSSGETELGCGGVIVKSKVRLLK